MTAVWGQEHASRLDYLRAFVRQLRRKLEDQVDSPRYLLTNNYIGYRFADKPRSSGRMNAHKEYLCLQGSKMPALSLIGLFAAALVLAAGDAPWKSKASPYWTEDDARQILNDSPWAKSTKALVARLQTEDERREGGNMGQARGVGFDGIEEKEETHLQGLQPASSISSRSTTRSRQEPTVTLLLRWESALPVRVAELKSHVVEPPTLEGDGYSLAVYGVPGRVPSRAIRRAWEIP